MNILYIFGFQYSLKLWKESGAIEREFAFFHRLSELEDIKFTLITYGDFEDFDILNQSNITIVPIFSLYKKTNSKILTFLYSVFLPFKLYKNLLNIDLVKTNQLTGSWVAILFSKLLKKPLYLRTGYDAYLFAKNSGKSFNKKLFFYQLTKLSYKFSSIYSVTSKSDYKHLIENFKFNEEKLKYRPNWVFTHTENKAFQTRSKDLLSVGRLEKQKNFSMLLDYLENTSFSLDIVGKGSLKNLLIEKSKKSHVDLKIIEPMSYFELNNLFENYKYFILPSIYEGNPKVLLEAMSHGCIPIASDIDNHREIINHTENGFLFDINNKNSLIKIFELLNNIELCEKISLSAAETIIKHFSFEKSIRQELEDYKKLNLNIY